MPQSRQQLTTTTWLCTATFLLHSPQSLPTTYQPQPQVSTRTMTAARTSMCWRRGWVNVAVLPSPSLDRWRPLFQGNARWPNSKAGARRALWCLRTQLIIIQQLIVMLGPNFLVSHHTPADCPDYCVVTTLQDCISLLVIIQGFSLVDVPLDATLSSFVTIVSWRVFVSPYN